MPNYYAHLKFGARILEHLPAPLAAALSSEREAFDLGCLGPDPLFFYHALLPNAVQREGLRMHRHSALPAAGRLRRAVESGIPMGRGYCAGFLCHLALDSACHGYIYRQAAEGPVRHMAMEGEFDRLLMEADGLEPVGRAYLPPIPAAPAVWEAAAAAYEHASPKQVEAAYRSMVLYTNLLAGSYGKRRGRILDVVSFLPTCGSIRGMSLNAVPNPDSAESSAILKDLLEGAVPGAAEQIAAFFAAIEQGTPIPAWFNRDFKGNPPPAAAEAPGWQEVHQH